MSTQSPRRWLDSWWNGFFREKSIDGFNASVDGLRGIAILLVVASHLVSMGFTAQLGTFFNTAMTAGWAGVDVFFVISGFLITGILDDTKHAANYFRSFYIRRALRIFPAYYLMLLWCFWLYPDVLGGKAVPHLPFSEKAWFLTYLNNYYFAYVECTFLWLGATWSLAIEEQFYFTWPLLVYFANRRVLTWICVLIPILSTIGREVLLAKGRFSLIVYFITPTHLDGLAIGALLSMLLRSGAAPNTLRKGAIATAVVAIAGFTFIGFYCHSLSWHTRPMELFGSPLVALLTASAIAYCTVKPSGLLAKSLSLLPLRFSGRLCYGIYLWHICLLAVWRDYLQKVFGHPLAEFPFWRAMAVLVAAMLIVHVFATLSYLAFERPLFRLKRYFPARSAA